MDIHGNFLSPDYQTYRHEICHGVVEFSLFFRLASVFFVIVRILIVGIIA